MASIWKSPQPHFPELSICTWYMTLLHCLVMYSAVSDRLWLRLFYCHASQLDFKVISILGFTDRGSCAIASHYGEELWFQMDLFFFKSWNLLQPCFIASISFFSWYAWLFLQDQANGEAFSHSTSTMISKCLPSNLSLQIHANKASGSPLSVLDIMLCESKSNLQKPLRQFYYWVGCIFH